MSREVIYNNEVKSLLIEDINSQLAMIESRQNELHLQFSQILEQLDLYEAKLHLTRKTVNFVKNKLSEMAKLMIELAEEVDSIRTSLNRKIDQVNPRLSESDMPAITNGCLIWHFSEYHEKEKKSLNEDVVFYSPFFYSSQYGYKLQAGARLNNKGIWKNAMLISLEPHSTPWDCLLKWPCKMNVTVGLLDQTSDRSKMKHKTKIFNNVSIDKDNHVFKTFIPKSLLHGSFIIEDSVLLFLKIEEV